MTARRALARDLVGETLPSPFHFRARNQSFQPFAAPFPGVPCCREAVPRRHPGSRNAAVHTIDGQPFTLHHRRARPAPLPDRLVPCSGGRTGFDGNGQFGGLPGEACGRVEEGRGGLALRRRPVSLPRSSNRTCPIKASGFPTDFIVGLTAAVQLASVVDAARRGPRILSHRGTAGRRALAPCAVERGSAGRGHGHDDRWPDTPASASHSRNTPTNRSEAGSVERAPRAMALYRRASGDRRSWS